MNPSTGSLQECKTLFVAYSYLGHPFLEND
jgi:hypothetical protein